MSDVKFSKYPPDCRASGPDTCPDWHYCDSVNGWCRQCTLCHSANSRYKKCPQGNLNCKSDEGKAKKCTNLYSKHRNSTTSFRDGYVGYTVNTSCNMKGIIHHGNIRCNMDKHTGNVSWSGDFTCVATVPPTKPPTTANYSSEMAPVVAANHNAIIIPAVLLPVVGIIVLIVALSLFKWRQRIRRLCKQEQTAVHGDTQPSTSYDAVNMEVLSQRITQERMPDEHDEQSLPLGRSTLSVAKSASLVSMHGDTLHYSVSTESICHLPIEETSSSEGDLPEFLINTEESETTENSSLLPGVDTHKLFDDEPNEQTEPKLQMSDEHIQCLAQHTENQCALFEECSVHLLPSGRRDIPESNASSVPDISEHPRAVADNSFIGQEHLTSDTSLEVNSSHKPPLSTISDVSCPSQTRVKIVFPPCGPTEHSCGFSVDLPYDSSISLRNPDSHHCSNDTNDDYSNCPNSFLTDSDNTLSRDPNENTVTVLPVLDNSECQLSGSQGTSDCQVSAQNRNNILRQQSSEDSGIAPVKLPRLHDAVEHDELTPESGSQYNDLPVVNTRVRHQSSADSGISPRNILQRQSAVEHSLPSVDVDSE